MSFLVVFFFTILGELTSQISQELHILEYDATVATKTFAMFIQMNLTFVNAKFCFPSSNPVISIVLTRIDQEDQRQTMMPLKAAKEVYLCQISRSC